MYAADNIDFNRTCEQEIIKSNTIIINIIL